MKKLQPRTGFLATALIAILFAVGSAQAVVLIRDDFSSNMPAEPILTNIAGRIPTEGPVWEGTAKVDGGTGLVADQVNPTSIAYSAIQVPADFKKLSVRIRYRLGKIEQLAFGFSNTDRGFQNNKGRANQGLMWVNIGGRRANLLAGMYSKGEKVENLSIPVSANVQDAVEVTLIVENRGEEAPFVRLIANGGELAAQELQPTERPFYRYFFIQFRGDTDAHSNAIIEHLTVQVD